MTAARDILQKRGDGTAFVRRGGRSRVAGMTLVELVLAMVLTTMVACAVANMLLAVSGSASSLSDSRSLMVGHGIAAGRIGAAVRSARSLLAAGEHYLVLWDERQKSDGVPQLSELHRIEFDPGAGELWSYRAPASLPDSLDVAFSLTTTDFDEATRARKGTASFPGQVWGIGVADWAINLGAATPREARYIGYRLTLKASDVNESTIVGAALRN